MATKNTDIFEDTTPDPKRDEPVNKEEGKIDNDVPTFDDDNTDLPNPTPNPGTILGLEDDQVNKDEVTEVELVDIRFRLPRFVDSKTGKIHAEALKNSYKNLSKGAAQYIDDLSEQVWRDTPEAVLDTDNVR